MPQKWGHAIPGPWPLPEYYWLAVSQKYNRLGRSKLDEKLHECSERQHNPRIFSNKAKLIIQKCFGPLPLDSTCIIEGILIDHPSTLGTYVVCSKCQKVQNFWADSNHVCG